MKNSWLIFFCLVSLNAQIDYTISNELKYGDGKAQGQEEFPESYDYFEDLLDINFYYENYNLFLQWEYSDPPPFGYSLRKLNKGFLEYENDNYRIVLGDLYTLYGSGLGINIFQDQNLDFDNSVRGIELDYTYNDNFRIFGVSGRGKYGYKTGKKLTERIHSIYIDNTLSALGMEFSFPSIPGDWMFLNINLNSANPFIEDLTDPISAKSLIIDMNNYAYSANIYNIDIYFELLESTWKDELNEVHDADDHEVMKTGNMKYAAIGTELFGYGLTLDYKNYYMPDYEYTISNPPIVFMETSSPLIGRNIHVININDEQGYQFEMVKLFGDLNFIHNTSLSYRNNGQYEMNVITHSLDIGENDAHPVWNISNLDTNTIDYPNPGVADILFFNGEESMYAYWPFRQTYNAIYGYGLDDKLFYKIGIDFKQEIISYHPTIIYEDLTNPSTVATEYWWNIWDIMFIEAGDSVSTDYFFELPILMGGYGGTVEEKIQSSIDNYQIILDSFNMSSGSYYDTLIVTDYTYENQDAITIPTQFSYELDNGGSFTSYIEFQKINNKFIRDNIYGNYTDESDSYTQEIDNNYFSLSYRSPDKWSLTLLYDREKIIQNGEKYSNKEWPGIDFSMDIDDNHQFSIFYGSQRGGLICANGVCAYQPAFEDGFKISFKSLF